MKTANDSGAARHVRAVGAAPIDDRSLWADSPVLGQSDLGAFAGRVFVEVWSDGAAYVVTSDEALYGPALAALHDVAPIRDSHATISATPATHARNATEFLGRVIVEFSAQGRPTVALIGPQEQRLVESARRRLSQLVAVS